MNKYFAIKIASFNTFGFCMATGIPTYLDPLLETIGAYGPRQYPLGFWILLIGPSIFVSNYLCLIKLTSLNFRIFLPGLILIFVGFCSLFNFLPEFPHGSVSTWILLFSLNSIISSWIHYTPLKAEHLNDISIDPSARIEWVKETAAFWRSISISIIVSYMGLLATWFMGSWDWVFKAVGDKGEQILVGLFSASQVTLFSIYFVFGPIFESLSKTKSTADLLLRIKK